MADITPLADAIHRYRGRKLTPGQVAAILGAVEAGERQVDVAERYGISQSWVSMLTRKLHDLWDTMDAFHATEQDLEDVDWELFHRFMTLMQVERRLRDEGRHLDED
jgi:hypothetical protein